MIDIVEKEHKTRANAISNIVATYNKAEDLINIGAYVNGSNPAIDHAIKMIEKVNLFLRQNIDEKIDFAQSRSQLLELFKE